MVCFSLDLSSMDTLDLLELGGYFLLHFREGFLYYLFKYFLMPLLLSSGMPMIWMLGWLTLSQMSLRLSSFLFILFYLFCSASVIFTILSCSSTSAILLLFPSNVFLISIILLFIDDFQFFTSSRSLLNISCIFSICASFLSVHPFYFQVFG